MQTKLTTQLPETWFKVFDADLQSGLSPNESCALGKLKDRMESSITNPDFYDKKTGRYYVIYTIAEMAKRLNLSERAISDIFKRLVNLGLITTKRQFNGANKIFLNRFKSTKRGGDEPQADNVSSVPAKSAGTEMQNLQVNQKTKSKNKTSNTINTENGQKNTENKAKELDDVSFDSWIESTANGYSMNQLIPETVAKYARYFDNPKDFAYRMIGTISRVRGFIAKKFGIKHSELSQFDSNANFGVKLADKIKSVMIHVIAKKMTDMDQILAYLNKSLQNFFTQATGKGFKTAQPGFAPSMSDENTSQKSKSQDKKQAVIPQWLKDQEAGIEPAVERPTVFEALKMKVMLNNFEDSGHRDVERVFVPKIKSLMAKYGIGMDVRTPEDNGSELAQAMGEIEAQIAAM